MNGKTALIAIVALALGFAGGYVYRGTNGGRPAPTDGEAADARAALDELLAYRGTGATAARQVIALVGEISRGGEDMLPALEKALKEVEPFQFSNAGFNVDMRNGEVSIHPDRRNALIEAVYRIGGDEAVRILIANAQGAGSWVNRVTAMAYLGQCADREDVRQLFQSLLKKIVVTRWLDAESRWFMDAMRGRLDADALPVLKEGLAGGWADAEMTDSMGRAMAEIDRQKAAIALGDILMKAGNAVQGRAAAARILAQMPEHRAATAKIILENGNATILESFLAGLRFGRLEFVESARAATTNPDPKVRLQYNRERLTDMEEAYKIAAAIRQKLNADQIQRVKLATYLELFDAAIQEARKVVKVSEQQVKGE